MPISWQFYADVGKTVPLPSIPINLATLGGSADFVAYFGTTSAGKQLAAASDPGVAPVQILPFDTAAGAGLSASIVKLALSAGGLDAAVGGAALNVGTVIGSNTTVTVHIRVTLPATEEGLYTDVVLRTNDVIESAV